MRASTVWQRSLSGISSYRRPASRVFFRDARQRIAARPLTRSFYIKTGPRLQLEEFFNRVQWPTTKAEEEELVASVGNAIWEGHNGGILHGFPAELSISAANQGSRQKVDKRTRTEEKAEAKRRKIENGEVQTPIYATEFSKEEIENEERRPKKKCAVLLGYSGTGYHGMQLYVLP